MAKISQSNINKILSIIDSNTIEFDTKLLDGSFDVTRGFKFTDKFKETFEYSQKHNNPANESESFDFAMNYSKMDFFMHYLPKSLKKYDHKSVYNFINEYFDSISSSMEKVVNHNEVKRLMSGRYKKEAISALVGYILESLNDKNRVPFIRLNGEDKEFLNGGMEFETGRRTLEK